MISHHHRCVFVHIPKCGGQSVETMFLRDLGLTWEQRAPLVMRPAARGELGPPMLAHLLARDYVRLRYLPQQLFDDYFKFAVVRDPFARAESTYRYLSFDRLMSFDRFAQQYVPDAARRPDHRMHWFLRPQVDFLVDENGSPLVDMVLDLADLDAELPAIADKLGVGDTTVPHVNVSKNQSRAEKARTVYRAVRDFGVRPTVVRRQTVRWTPDSRASIAAAYAADFEIQTRISG